MKVTYRHQCDLLLMSFMLFSSFCGDVKNFYLIFPFKIFVVKQKQN